MLISKFAGIQFRAILKWQLSEREMDFLVDFGLTLFLAYLVMGACISWIRLIMHTLNRWDVYTEDCSHSLKTNKKLQTGGFIWKQQGNPTPSRIPPHFCTRCGCTLGSCSKDLRHHGTSPHPTWTPNVPWFRKPQNDQHLWILSVSICLMFKSGNSLNITNDVEISLKSPENNQLDSVFTIFYRTFNPYPGFMADINPALLKKLAPAATALVATTDSSRGRVPKAHVLKPLVKQPPIIHGSFWDFPLETIHFILGSPHCQGKICIFFEHSGLFYFFTCSFARECCGES